MKSLFGFFVLASISGTAFSQQLAAAQVPAAVKSAFTQSNPTKYVRWEREKGNYEAGFKIAGVYHSILYTPTGLLLETEVTIEKESLPAPAWQYVKHTYKSSIKEAAKITKAGGTVNYEAEVDKLDLIFDADGTFIRIDKD